LSSKVHHRGQTLVHGKYWVRPPWGVVPVDMPDPPKPFHLQESRTTRQYRQSRTLNLRMEGRTLKTMSLKTASCHSRIDDRGPQEKNIGCWELAEFFRMELRHISPTILTSSGGRMGKENQSTMTLTVASAGLLRLWRVCAAVVRKKETQ